MVRSVVKRGDPILLKPTREVIISDSVRELVDDLWDTLIAVQGLYNFTRGSGLSANQIGSSSRVCVLEFDGTRHTLINPRLIYHSEQQLPVREGCLSFFDYRGKALRYADVRVAAVNIISTPVTVASDGNLDFASLIQHELGHLDGELYDRHLAPGERLVKMPEMPRIA